MTSYIQTITRVLGLHEYRKARNLLLQPALQLRLPLYILLLSVTFLTLGIILGNAFFQQTWMSMMATSTQPDYLLQVIAQQVADFRLEMVLLLLVYSVVVTVVSTIFLHRLIGPTIPIKRHIQALTQGRYDQRVKLRRHDSLQDVAAELNQLAETLQQNQRQA